jgi:hypothetical protein
LVTGRRGGGGDAVEGVDRDDEEDEDGDCDEDVDEEGYARAGEVADFGVRGFGAEVLGLREWLFGGRMGGKARGLREFRVWTWWRGRRREGFIIGVITILVWLEHWRKAGNGRLGRRRMRELFRLLELTFEQNKHYENAPLAPNNLRYGL